MTKEGALYSFWRGFSLPAFEENSVPTGENAPDFPYITYQVATNNLYNDVALTGSIWYDSTSWKEINAKAEEISEHINNAKPIKCDNGYVWIKKGNPISQSLGDPLNDKIKRKIINIEVNYLTEY